MKTNIKNENISTANSTKLSSNYKLAFDRLERIGYSTQCFENLGLSELSCLFAVAFKTLGTNYHPHPCGGFTTDDVQWWLGMCFLSDTELEKAIEELTESKLIRYAGFDDDDGIGHCYEFR